MNKKLSIEKCSKILNTSDKKYTKEQVELVRDYLYEIAQIQVDHFDNLQSERSHTLLQKRCLRNKGLIH